MAPVRDDVHPKWLIGRTSGPRRSAEVRSASALARLWRQTVCDPTRPVCAGRSQRCRRTPSSKSVTVRIVSAFRRDMWRRDRHRPWRIRIEADRLVVVGDGVVVVALRFTGCLPVVIGVGRVSGRGGSPRQSRAMARSFSPFVVTNRAAIIVGHGISRIEADRLVKSAMARSFSPSRINRRRGCCRPWRTSDRGGSPRQRRPWRGRYRLWHQQAAPTITVRQHELWIEADRFAVVGDRVVIVAFRHSRPCRDREGLSVRRIEADRLAVVGDAPGHCRPSSVRAARLL